MIYTYKDIKKGVWFTCADWHNGNPFLKVSNLTFYDPRDGEFTKFSDSVFEYEGDPVYNVILVEEDKWLINGRRRGKAQ